MPGTAGDLSYYLVDTPEGTRKLPRVTHILKSIIAKPELMSWYYRYTRDAISGLVAQLLEMHPGDNPDDFGDFIRELLDTLSDADMLEDYLAANKMRPDDWAKERADEGSDRHDFFERLGRAAMEADGLDIQLAQQGLDSDDGFEHAVADFWLTERPRVVAAETQLLNIVGGYGGTVDQIAYRERYQDSLMVTDLKTRRADTPCGVAHKTPEAARACHEIWPYDSDHVQTAPYLITYNEQNELEAQGRTVLIAQKDGRWREEVSTIDISIWPDIMSVYHKLGKEV